MTRQATGAVSTDAIAEQIRPKEATHLIRAIERWQGDMERRGCAPNSVKVLARGVVRMIEYAGWSQVDQLELRPAIEYLTAQRKQGWSGPTHDHAVTAIRNFGRFLHVSGDLPTNPFEHLEASGECGGEGARALTTPEVRALVSAAAGRLRDTGKGADAGLFYGFLAHTGLRHEEAGRCLWRDLDLNDGLLITDPKWAKNGKRDVVPIHPELLAVLPRHKATVPDRNEQPVFPRTPNRHTWHIDREAAGIAREDQRRRAATFHSLRKYLATQLDKAGASPGVVAKILRHADGITQQRYIDADLSAEVEAMKSLPNILECWSQKSVDKARAASDTHAATLMQNTPHSSSIPSPVGPPYGSASLLTRSAGPTDNGIQHGPQAFAETVLATPNPRVQHDNGHCRACAEYLTVIETQARTIMALAAALKGAVCGTP